MLTRSSKVANLKFCRFFSVENSYEALDYDFFCNLKSSTLIPTVITYFTKVDGVLPVSGGLRLKCLMVLNKAVLRVYTDSSRVRCLIYSQVRQGSCRWKILGSVFQGVDLDLVLGSCDAGSTTCWLSSRRGRSTSMCWQVWALAFGRYWRYSWWSSETNKVIF